MKAIKDFVAKGKKAAFKQMSPQQKKEMLKGAIELDPMFQIDKEYIESRIKLEEEQEEYVYEEHNIQELSRELFLQLVGERELRVKMEKTKEENSARLTNLKDFLNYLNGQREEIK